MDESMASFRATFATRRFRFMLRHNPAYFINAIKAPKEFWGSLAYLIKNYLNALLDASNGRESWVVKLQGILGRNAAKKVSPQLAVKKA
jgi:hypothetical protein